MSSSFTKIDTLRFAVSPPPSPSPPSRFSWRKPGKLFCPSPDSAKSWRKYCQSPCSGPAPRSNQLSKVMFVPPPPPHRWFSIFFRIVLFCFRLVRFVPLVSFCFSGRSLAGESSCQRSKLEILEIGESSDFNLVHSWQEYQFLVELPFLVPLGFLIKKI